jgi:putative glutamine amidotransferase
MVRPVISSYQQLNAYQPRIAVIEDTASPASKKVLELIKQVGGKPMVIPRFLSDRLLATQGLSKAQITHIKNARNAEEIREFDQQVATATRLHLQYITRKLTFVDAVVLPGNQYDIPPSAYHDIDTNEKTRLAPPVDVRFQTELVMTDYAMHSRKIPILGISGGMQLLVVKTGGKLIQHIPEYDNFEKQVLQNAQITSVSRNALPLMLEKISFRNEQMVSNLSTGFTVTQPRSIIGAVLSSEEFENKTVERLAVHLNHQAVRPDDVNQKELKITALTADGNYVEAVEHQYHPFCLGVQFHPEYHDEMGFKMIKEVVDYARQLKSSQFDNKAKVPFYVDMQDQNLAATLVSLTPQAPAQRLEMRVQ